jgi:hypothetical protein
MRFTSGVNNMVEKYVTKRLFGRTVIDSLDLNQNAWYIDEAQVTRTAAELNVAGAAKGITAAMLGSDVAGAGLTGGNGVAIALDATKFHTDIVPGTGVGAEVTVTGMGVGDRIVSVIAFVPATPALATRTSEYVAAAGKMTKAAGTDDSLNQLIVTWIDIA